MTEGLHYEICNTIRSDDLADLVQFITPENVNRAIYYDRSAIELAAQHNAHKCFLWLFNVMKANLGESLFLLVREHNLDTVALLLRNGANPNSIDKSERSVLSHALDNPVMVQLLLSYGVDVNSKSHAISFRSALDYAAYNATNKHFYEQSKVLIDKRKKEQSKFRDSARLLIEAGAYTDDIEQCNDKAKVALIQEIKQNMATKKKHCRSAIIALFFTLKSYGVPRDLIRFMLKHINWKNECWLHVY